MARGTGRPRASGRPVTLTDVASAAQTSKAAAARALGGYGSVSADLRQRIMDAARQLDYRPNELARTMATGRSRTVGLIVGDIENPFFARAARGVSDAARAAGVQVILCNSGEDVAEERAAARMLLAKRVDGLIVAPAAMREPAHLQDAMARGCKLVLLDREVLGLAADAALVDDREAARGAVRHLVAAGHRRIAYLTATRSAQVRYSPKRIMLTTVRDRIAGFLEASREAGLASPEQDIRLGATDTLAAQAIVADLLRGPRRPTAVLASDSKVALGVFRAVKALGLVVPRDVSLISFDDADWTAATSPAVTVVAQPAYQLGQEAARLLLDRIGSECAAPRRCVLRTVLIVRDSVSPPG